MDSELAMLIVYKQTPRPLRKICQVLPIKEGPHTPELPSKILPRTMTINPALPDLHGVASADGEPTETSLPWVWPGHPRTTLLQVKWGHCYATFPASAIALGGKLCTGQVRSYLVKSFNSLHCRWSQWQVNCHLGSWSIWSTERPWPPPLPQWVALLIPASCLWWFGINGLGQEHWTKEDFTVW